MRLPYVWDYDIDAAQFADLLAGRLTLGRLNRDWAAVRLLEYAPYPEIVRVLGYRALLEGWPRWRGVSVPKVASGASIFWHPGCRCITRSCYNAGS